MYWQYLVLAGLASILSLSLVALVWPHRRAYGAVYFILLMIIVFVWALTNAIESMPLPAESKILWSQISYISIVSGGPLWLLLALSYGQQLRRWSRFHLLLLWIIPCIILVLAATNGHHGLLWSRITPISAKPGAALIYERGIAFWINAVYVYTCMLAGTLVFIRVTLRSTKLYRHQIGALFLGAVLPWIGNLWYLLRLNPWPELDKTPVAFALSGLMVAYGLSRFRLFDIVPVARELLIEKMADGVLVLDVRNRIVDANPAVCYLLGCSAAQIIGQPAKSVLARWNELAEQYRDVSQTQVEIELSDNLWFDLSISPLYDQRQQINGRLIVLHDITARKRAELHLEQYAQELQASNIELDTFAHTVAHDLKSPLSTLMGYSQLLEKHYARLDDVQRLEMIAILRRNSQSMSSIIDELLMLAGIRQMDEIPLAPFDMSEVVTGAQERMGLLIQENHVEINMPETWPGALGYAPWIQEVWANYLSNAIKYGGNPEEAIPPRLQLGWTVLSEMTNVSPKADGLIRFWVQDNGPGLTLEEQTRLFTPFTRLDQVSTKGHGLGLSIVQRIIAKFGGQVGVESEIGRGSTFWFTLPSAPPQ